MHGRKGKNMKKRLVCAILVLSLSILPGCGNNVTEAEEIQKVECVCPSCGYEWVQTTDGTIVEKAEDILAHPTTEAESTTIEASESMMTTTVQESTTETEVQTEDITETQTEEIKVNPISQLSEGEKQARRELQADLKTARQQLYALPNSPEKVLQINQVDKQILENNVYDFSDKTVQFIGDSITEGITAMTDSDGTKLTYMQYANKYLNIGTLIESGMAGRMFADFGGKDYSLAATRSNTVYYDADVYVIYLGLNDYLSTPESKRYGNINEPMSTAGYCGAVRDFMKYMQLYFSDKQLVFVTAYPLSNTVTSNYTDAGMTTQPMLKDYMDVLKQLAKEYNFAVIDLYNDGFMDCTSAEVSNFFLADGTHPNNVGYQILGEHLAAELSLLLGK